MFRASVAFCLVISFPLISMAQVQGPGGSYPAKPVGNPKGITIA
jgi:hypothetical protein